MKTLKIRAWDYVTEQMFYDFVDKNYTISLETGKLTISTGGADYDYRELILLLWTGYKDKESNEIYQGDILTGNGRTSYVVYENHSFRLKHDPGNSWNWEEFTVLGNIYQNLEIIDLKA